MQTVPAPGPPTIQLKARSESSSGTPTVTQLPRSPNGSDPRSTPLRNIGLSSKDSSSPAVAESNASGCSNAEADALATKAALAARMQLDNEPDTLATSAALRE